MVWDIGIVSLNWLTLCLCHAVFSIEIKLPTSLLTFKEGILITFSFGTFGTKNHCVYSYQEGQHLCQG